MLQFPAHGSVVATDVHAHDCARNGIISGKLTGTQVTVDPNGGAGINADGRVKGTAIAATDNLVGVQSSRFVIGKGYALTGNGFAGVIANRVKIADSTATGNNGIDIGSARAPKLKNTICEHSFVVPGGGSWGVCSLD